MPRSECRLLQDRNGNDLTAMLGLFAADGLSKLVKEGEAMGLCLEQDSMSRPLLTRTKLCRDWLDQVQAVVQRLAVSHSTT